MSSIESHTWTSNAVVLWVLRALQYSVSVVTLGLTAFAVKFFSGSSTTCYAIAVSVISLLYVVLVFLVALSSPGSFYFGGLLIAELIVMILWFCAFIAMAVAWGSGSCEVWNSIVAYYYGGLIDAGKVVRQCNCAKAAVAMCAFAWLLFAISSFFLLRNIGLPLARDHTATSWWESLSSRGLAVHKATALTLVSNRSYAADIETAAYKEEVTTLGNSHAEPTLNEKTYGDGQADMVAVPEAPPTAVQSTGPEAAFVFHSNNEPIREAGFQESQHQRP